MIRFSVVCLLGTGAIAATLPVKEFEVDGTAARTWKVPGGSGIALAPNGIIQATKL